MAISLLPLPACACTQHCTHVATKQPGATLPPCRGEGQAACQQGACQDVPAPQEGRGWINLPRGTSRRATWQPCVARARQGRLHSAIIVPAAGHNAAMVEGKARLHWLTLPSGVGRLTMASRVPWGARTMGVDVQQCTAEDASPVCRGQGCAADVQGAPILG